MKAEDTDAPTGRLIETIHRAFGATPHPGDAFLQGSFDGCEPFEEVGHFTGKPDWTALEPGFLDQRYCALGFLSEGGFRFYLPAYLVADVRRQLRTADPSFHLTHGLDDRHRATLVNPRRYGAMRWVDYARYRLSVFTREESAAIVDYLRWRRDRAGDEAGAIDAALAGFWLERARSAPPAGDLGPG